jgi:hypothetical protein
MKRTSEWGSQGELPTDRNLYKTRAVDIDGIGAFFAGLHGELDDAACFVVNGAFDSVPGAGVDVVNSLEKGVGGHLASSFVIAFCGAGVVTFVLRGAGEESGAFGSGNVEAYPQAGKFLKIAVAEVDMEGIIRE